MLYLFENVPDFHSRFFLLYNVWLDYLLREFLIETYRSFRLSHSVEHINMSCIIQIIRYGAHFHMGSASGSAELLFRRTI